MPTDGNTKPCDKPARLNRFDRVKSAARHLLVPWKLLLAPVLVAFILWLLAKGDLAVWNCVLTACLLAVTGVYAYLTHRIASANERSVATMRDQIRASVRPYVYFELVPHGPLLEARLRNIGKTAAHDITIQTEPRLWTTALKVPQPSKLTDHQTAFLSPGGEVVEFIGSWDEFQESVPFLGMTGTVSYRDAAGESYTEAFRIDLSVRGEMAYIGRPDPAQELKAISETLSRICHNLEKRQD